MNQPASDPLERIVVVGTSCSGKTTLATKLAETLGVSHIELDTHYWGPNWTPRPRERFLSTVREAVLQPRWVCDGNFSPVRELVWSRATSLLWLDYSFGRVFCQAFRRTMGRCLRSRRLYSGNRETFSRSFLSRESILLWVMKTYWHRRQEYPKLFLREEYAHLQIQRFLSPSQTKVFMQQIGNSFR